MLDEHSSSHPGGCLRERRGADAQQGGFIVGPAPV